MYQISQLASKTGLSRTALLYYEKLQLIKGKRLSNGYRVYSELDVEKVRLIQQLQQGGLSLKECKACLEEKIDKSLLLRRLTLLDDEIQQKQSARRLLASMLGIEQGDEKLWHEAAIKQAPQAHFEWLKIQGFNEREALRIKWLSKNMTQHDDYMNDFMKIFATLERWGPGIESETEKAISLIPVEPKEILEIGCGQGLSTRVLAKQFDAQIIAVDNEQSALDNIEQYLAAEKLSPRVKTVCASMTELPFSEHTFDLIWAEACAYIMGFEKALKAWKPLLKADGILAISDLVLPNENVSKEVLDFWQKEYPDVTTVEARGAHIKQAGFEILADFAVSKDAWDNYYIPLKARIEQLEPEMSDSAAIKDCLAEAEFYFKHHQEFDYQMFILKPL